MAGTKPVDGRQQTVGSRQRVVGARVLAALLLVLTAGACAREVQPDAYGNVEATDVTVAAEAAGQLVSLTVEEGQSLAAGASVGTVDPSRLTLERDQASAQREVAASRVGEVDLQIRALEAQRAAAVAQREAAQAQRAVLESQLEIARRTFDRTRRLLDQQAATVQQMDQAERDVRVLENQITAQAGQIEAQARQVDAQTGQIALARAQRTTATAQVGSNAAQVAQVEDRLRRSNIRNPSAGTVLAKYAEAGEIVQVGQPLYRIADLSTVDVRAYVGEAQIAAVKLGGAVDVGFDGNLNGGTDTPATLPGTVTWVSSEAEFTPTPIQTRDERADLVYAIKVRVPNPDGRLKLGMPVDVTFRNGQ